MYFVASGVVCLFICDRQTIEGKEVQVPPFHGCCYSASPSLVPAFLPEPEYRKEKKELGFLGVLYKPQNWRNLCGD
jgi:hypothetical protein